MIPASAFCFSAPVGSATFVMYGCCKNDCCWGTGPMATPKGVEVAWNWFDTTLSTQINMLGDATESSQNMLTATFSESKKLSMQTIEDMIKGYSNAKEKMNQAYYFGEVSEAYLGDHIENMTPKIKIGNNAEKILSTTLNEDINQHANSYNHSHEIMDRYSSQNMDDIITQNAIPKKNSYQLSEFEKAIVNMKNIVNPFPSSTISDNTKETQSGKDYLVLKNIIKSNNAVSQKIINEIVSSYTPTLDVGDDVQAINEQIDDAGQSVQIVDNKISPMSYLQYMSDMRFGDNKWIFGPSGLTSMSKTGVIREVLILESLLLEVDKRIAERLYQMNVALAQMTSDKVRTNDMVMNKELSNVINAFLYN